MLRNWTWGMDELLFETPAWMFRHKQFGRSTKITSAFRLLSSRFFTQVNLNTECTFYNFVSVGQLRIILNQLRMKIV